CCPSAAEPQATTTVLSTHGERSPSLSRQRREALPGLSPPAAGHLSQTAGRYRPTARSFACAYMLPVSPFVGVICTRHHPLMHSRSGHCLAATAPSFRSLLLRPHSPTTAFEAPR